MEKNLYTAASAMNERFYRQNKNAINKTLQQSNSTASIGFVRIARESL